MKVYLLNCSSTLNYGSMMMAENFIYYFSRRVGEEVDFYVPTVDDRDIERLRSATGHARITRVPVNSLFSESVKRRDYFLGLLGLSRPVSDLARDMDLVVVLGGDDFTEDYGRFGPIVNSLKLGLVNRSGPPVVLVAQTMGPYTWWLRWILGLLLRGLSRIYARERGTHNYLLRMGLSNVALSYDLALLPLARQPQSAISSGAYVVFCPSQLIHRYAVAGDWMTSVEENVAIVEGLLSRFPSKSIVVLAHVLRPADSDDRIMVRAILDQLPPERSQRVFGRDETLLPYEVRAIIQQSHLVVSSRMHPVVSAIQLGVPAIAIAYSSKFHGIIADGARLGDFIVDVRDHGAIPARVADRVEAIERNREEVIRKMKEYAKDAERELGGLFDELTQTARTSAAAGRRD